MRKSTVAFQVNGIIKMVYNIVKTLVMIIFLVPGLLIFTLINRIKCKHSFKKGLKEAGINSDIAKQLIHVLPGISKFLNGLK